jgi:hypothetical protein
LPGEVPFVDGARRIEPLIALQPDQPAAQRGGDGLGNLRLADACLTLEEKRLAQLQGQISDGAQITSTDVVLTVEKRDGVIDAAGDSLHVSSLP